jgi:membrane-bound ClpP family serine protease
MGISRLITGITLLSVGIIFILFAVFSEWWLVFYGVPLLIFGIIILFNKNEDNIEERLDTKCSQR